MYNLKLLILRYLSLLGLRLNLPILSFIAINFSKSGHKIFNFKKKLKKKLFLSYINQEV